MRKKIKIANIFILLQLFIVLFFVPVFASFPDVPETHINFRAINYVEEKSIVGGYSDGTFRPDANVTRAEFTKIIINSLYQKETIDACNDSSFPDVNNDYKFIQYICVAKTENIINGFTDGSYKPENNITFAEASKIIVNAFSLQADLTQSDGKTKLYPYIAKLKEYNSVPSTILDYENSLKRGEMAEILYGLQVYIDSNSRCNTETRQLYLDMIGELEEKINFLKIEKEKAWNECIDSYDTSYEEIRKSCETNLDECEGSFNGCYNVYFSCLDSSSRFTSSQCTEIFGTGNNEYDRLIDMNSGTLEQLYREYGLNGCI